jgi:phosphoenolpyruvate synthase/pyruvate phosphate dikinase
MEGPEHVYPAVLLLKTVPSDKSGVMITADVDNGDRNVLSVAVNEGVGGAVEGQAAESLRIDRRSGDVRLLAVATAPTRHVPQPSGGVAELPASGAESLLQPGEIRQLIGISTEIPEKFPPIVDDQGRPAPADIEFAFVDGKLQLLQIRPFLESRKAKGSGYLMRMDEGLTASRGKSVNLAEVPR